MNLRHRVDAALYQPLTNAGVDALEAFFALPRVDAWAPEKILLAELSTVFDIGLPMSLLRGVESSLPHQVEIGRALAAGNRPPPQLVSEVHAAALLAYWGAQIAFVPQESYPTPDLRACLHGKDVDVEVVRGDLRREHRSVQDALGSFAGALRPVDISWNLVGFMIDASNLKELNDLFDAATNLRPGKFAEKTGRWIVRAVSLDEREKVVGADSTEAFAPKWWPKSEPCYFCTSTLIGTCENPVVLIRSAIPDAPYTNPILRKATSGQRRQNIPYVIAFDVGELPRAHERLAAQLVEYFKIWTHVSAVLLFEPCFYIGIERKEWRVSLHLNPNAASPISSPSGRLPGPSRSTVEFSLSSAHSE